MLEATSIILNFVLAIQTSILTKKVNVLRKENARLRGQDHNYKNLQDEVKDMLQSSTEIEIIKFLRQEKGLSMIDAKKLVDSVK